MWKSTIYTLKYDFVGKFTRLAYISNIKNCKYLIFLLMEFKYGEGK